MAFRTPNLDLYVWDLNTDAYDHSELASNWQTLDAHDHNEAEGRGTYIGTDSLAPLAVTNPKLADCAVTKRNICGRQIGSDQIELGSIGAELLDPDLVFVPLGLTSPWFRPSTSVAVPTGWAVADGATLAEGDHDWGTGSVTLPNLTNKFVLGAGTSDTGTTPDKAPAEKAQGGSHTLAFAHTHAIPSHSHTVNAHSHSIPGHAHGLAGGVASGSHAHSYTIHDLNDNGHVYFKRYLTSERVAVQTYDIDVPSSVASTRKGFLAIAGRDQGQNIVGGIDPYSDVTDSTSLSLGLSGSTQQNASGTTGDAGSSTSATGLTTNSSLDTKDIRPGYVGLLYIVKVKK